MGIILEFIDVVISRKSVRDYSDKEVEEEKITQILEAARIAPSWANKQCCNFIVVKDKAKIGAMSVLLNLWLKNAPMVIAACADPKGSGTRNGMDYYLVDVGISMHQLILAATNAGLGTCWLAAFDEEKVKKVLEVPENVKVVALTPLGYSKESGLRNAITRKVAGSDKRKPLQEIVHREKW